MSTRRWERVALAMRLRCRIAKRETAQVQLQLINHQPGLKGSPMYNACLPPKVNISVSVDSSWLSWGEWSHCSLSCGNGNRNRGRGCTGGKEPTFCDKILFKSVTNFVMKHFLAAPAFDGQHCSGSTTETEHCNTDPCPGEGCQLCFANVPLLPAILHFCLCTPFL